MYKILYADKDTYIQNRVINGVMQVSGNVGRAGSLDLFKLYGYTSTLVNNVATPNVELSHLLIHFDLTDLRNAITVGKVDITNSTFSCRLHLCDVYGGQPTPDHFTVAVYPLSASFDEGHGNDVVYYSDYDVANWQSGSLAGGAWGEAGCDSGNDAQLGEHNPTDYIMFDSSDGNFPSPDSAGVRQFFVKGIEDLDVDVTALIVKVLNGQWPDVGFRIALDAPLEADTHSYFVKRFGSRSAYNVEKRPRLIVRFDDSIQDDTQNLYMDSPSTLFMYNFVRGATLGNLLSASNPVTGQDSLILQMQTPVSGGTYSLFFSGSQYYSGQNPQTGIYSASILIPSTDLNLIPQFQASGSITFTPIWQSLDRTVSYLTGTAIVAHMPVRGPSSRLATHLNISVFNLLDEYNPCTQEVIRVNIWDYTEPYLTSAVKLPVELPGIIIRDVHYQIRDSDTGYVAVPFDLKYNSTRLSNDSRTMYFTLDTTNLTPGHAYVVDIMVVTDGAKQTYRDASAVFRVVPEE